MIGRVTWRDVLAAFWFWLVGCAAPAQIEQPMQQTTFEAAGADLLAAWDAAELEQPSEHCAQEVLATDIAIVDGAGMLERCSSSSALGCTRFVSWDNHPIVTLRAGVASPGTLVHELAHVLSRCALGDSDHDHRNAEVWRIVIGLGGEAFEP